MGDTRRRCTNFFLSLTILVLGIISTVLLYNAGQKTIDLFWGPSNIYKDKLGRINRRVVTDYWYGLLVLRGWGFGFLYIVPGLSGIAAALFYNRLTMIIHLAVAILVLVPGSVLHSIGGVGLVMYRLLVVEGASRYDPWLGDCIYVSDTAIPYTYQDAQCLLGRKALNLAIAAVFFLLVSWIFVFTHVLYCAFTFYNVTGNVKKLKISRPAVKYQYLKPPTSDVETSLVPDGDERATGTQPGSSPTRHRKKMTPSSHPEPSSSHALSIKPHPSTSTEETGDGTTGTSGIQDGGSHSTSGIQAHGRETPVAVAGEDIQLQNITQETARAQEDTNNERV